MRGRFSIEWMAQSSHQTPAANLPALAGTPPDSLPGFYAHHRAPSGQQAAAAAAAAASTSAGEPGFASSTEEETSGYESEGGAERAPSPPARDAAPPAPPSPPAGRRPRTAFTAEQISSLERAFKRNAYLGTQDKAELCRKLSLSDKQIRNWFQNRRMKLKRSVQDALAQACQASVASHFYPELQPFRPGPYARFQPTAASPELLPYASPLPPVSTLPLDSLYQYGGLQGAAAPTIMASYPAYPQYY